MVPHADAPFRAAAPRLPRVFDNCIIAPEAHTARFWPSRAIDMALVNETFLGVRMATAPNARRKLAVSNSHLVWRVIPRWN